MPLDDLVQVIETIQQRIRDHGDSLRQNEIRTRVALIDPLLTALGWDVSDPGLVTAEYNVGNGRADYAPLVPGNKPTSLVEAKHLGEQLESPNHQEQVFTYALMQQVKYAGLTDGNRWVLDDVSDFSGERRKLDITIANMPAYQCALKFLLLWRPNMASGQPVSANEPILDGALSDVSVVEPVVDDPPTGPVPPGEGWTSLADFHFVSGGKPPALIRFPREGDRKLGRWNRILLESAEYLVRIGRLTPQVCPVPVPGSARYSVHREAIHSDGKGFTVSRKLSNDLLCEVNVSGSSAVIYTKSLLQHCGQDLATIWLKLE